MLPPVSRVTGNVKKKITKPKGKAKPGASPGAHKNPKANKCEGGGNFLGGHRAKAKICRFNDRCEELSLKISHCLRAFHDDTWQEVKSSATQSLLKKADEMLNGKGSDDNWRLFQDQSGLLSEKGLAERAKFVMYVRQLGTIQSFVDAYAKVGKPGHASGEFVHAVQEVLEARHQNPSDWKGYQLHHSFMESTLVAVFKENVSDDQRGEKQVGKELMMLSSLDETTCAKFSDECPSASVCQSVALYSIGLERDAMVQLQCDMWLTAFSYCLRDKDQLSRTLWLCDLILKCDGFFADTEIMDDVLVVQEVITWFLAEDRKCNLRV